MNSARKLLAIKLIHTIIWAFFVIVIFYVLYSGVVNNVNLYTWIGIALIVGEGIVLMIFNMVCPLTVMARKYANPNRDNFDIFLPNWLARHNKMIFTSIYIVAVIIVIYRVL